MRSEGLGLLSPAGLAALRDYRIATIVDLRSAGERSSEAGPLSDDPGYRHVPVLDDDDLAAVSRIRTHLGIYRYMLDRRGERVADALRAVATSTGPVLIHCKAGKDRTGVIVALLLATVGVERESIVADYALSESLLMPLYALWNRAGDAPPPGQLGSRFSSPPEAMRSLLDWISAESGGVGGYLDGIGVDEADRLRVHQLLLAP